MSTVGPDGEPDWPVCEAAELAAAAGRDEATEAARKRHVMLDLTAPEAGNA
jgi:hypothetical protein